MLDRRGAVVSAIEVIQLAARADDHVGVLVQCGTDDRSLNGVARQLTDAAHVSHVRITMEPVAGRCLMVTEVRPADADVVVRRAMDLPPGI